MTARLALLAPCLVAAFALSCGGPDTGPVDVTWDRDACEHCSMAIG